MNKVITQLDINQIVNLLPQRYPFLLVDRIVEIVPRTRALGIKNVSMNEPYFQGHFPVNPIMPGVLILEALAQVTTVLYKYENDLTPSTKYEVILGSVKGRFLHAVYPGDQMIIEVVAVKFISTGGIAKGTCTVGDTKICVAELGFAATGILP
jgi:3-hydroxyacyl-[acyl-carrier-protein] dehydratase